MGEKKIGTNLSFFLLIAQKNVFFSERLDKMNSKRCIAIIHEVERSRTCERLILEHKSIKWYALSFPQQPINQTNLVVA